MYQQIICQHFNKHEQMLFLAGPRQVGKTTLAKVLAQDYVDHAYLNFDIEADRELILQGASAITEKMDLARMRRHKPLLIFDEIHKHKQWKNFLKGFYDEYKLAIHILVTGSAKLNIFQKGGDSLMGRYLLYRMHPLSIAELVNGKHNDKLLNPVSAVKQATLQQLFQHGGFPNPYLKHDAHFSSQWQRLRRQQLFREDIRSIKHVQDIALMEMLARLLRSQSGQQVNFSSLAKALRVSVDSVTRWIGILEEFYYCFRIRPWYNNVKRSLVKEPKVFLWDWSELTDEGAKWENLVACHLHKAIHFWTDYGYGEYGLYYLRDKSQREVDFLVTRNDEPWFLVEVKTSTQVTLSKNLAYFQQQINAPHAFQIAPESSDATELSGMDCFTRSEPVKVGLGSFLSQLK